MNFQKRKAVFYKHYVLAIINLLVAFLSSSLISPTFADQGPIAFSEQIKSFHQALSQNALTPESCAATINDVTEKLYQQSAEDFFPRSPKETDFFRHEGMNILNSIFALRLKIFEVFQGFKNPSQECVSAVRRASRFARFAEDALVEWLWKQNLLPQTKVPFGAAQVPFVLVNPAFKNLELQSGDVILMRGQRAIGATIARSGDDAADFSHLAIVGESPNGELTLVESLIETGLIQNPLAKWGQKSETRIVVFRANNQRLRKKAGRYAYDWAAQAKVNGNDVHYDFKMDLNDNYAKIFCAEAVRKVFDVVTNGKMLLPKYQMTFRNAAHSQIFKNLGISSEQTFAPVDIELDPNFTMVGEFRAVESLRVVRLRDAILSQMFSWMNQEGYELVPELFDWVKAHLGQLLNQLDTYEKIGVGPQLQDEMTTQAILTALVLDRAVARIEETVAPAEQQYFDSRKHAMSFREIVGLIEDSRKKDCEDYLEGKKAPIHEILRPRTLAKQN